MGTLNSSPWVLLQAHDSYENIKGKDQLIVVIQLVIGECFRKGLNILKNIKKY